MPVMIGHGNSQLTRYYFNAALEQCIPFVYSGFGGNSNNFQTISDCANACVIYGNNNYAGRPFIGQPMGRHRMVGSDFNDRNNGNMMMINNGRSNEMMPTNNNYREEIFNNNGGNYNHREQQQQQQQRPSSNYFSRLCPQGEPLLTDTGLPVSCSLQSAQQCPHDGYVCNVMANGDAFCCPDPSKCYSLYLSSSFKKIFLQETSVYIHEILAHVSRLLDCKQNSAIILQPIRVFNLR